MKALVLYDSLGGNTEKVADRIHKTLAQGGVESEFIKVAVDTDIDLYDYDRLGPDEYNEGFCHGKAPGLSQR